MHTQYPKKNKKNNETLLKNKKLMVSIRGEFQMNTLQVIYGDTKINLPEGTALENIKVAMAENFPELENANVAVNGNVIEFTAKAGTKGATNMENLKVIYGDTKIDLPAGTELTSIKAAMAENFPELENANVQVNGNEIVFTAKAGTKGAGEMETVEVVYGDTKINLPASTELADIKVAMAENFPELENANVTVSEGQIVFSAKAGTKGADQLDVVYGDTKITLPANTGLEQIKVAMAENFPELENANVVQEGNRIIFSAKAGTKGN